MVMSWARTCRVCAYHLWRGLKRPGCKDAAARRKARSKTSSKTAFSEKIGGFEIG